MEIKGEVSRKTQDPRNKRRGPRDPLCARLCASRKRFVLGWSKAIRRWKGKGPRASRITSLASSRICYGWVDCRLKLISFWRHRIFMNVSCRSLLRDNKLYDESLAWSLCKSETVLSVFRPRVPWHVGGRGEKKERKRERQKRNEHETCGISEVTVGSRSVFHYGIYVVINWIRSIFFFIILI